MVHNCGCNMVCIEDFQGWARPSQGDWFTECTYWADWCPQCKVTTFGGYWAHIPSLKSDLQPSSDAVHLYAEIFGGWQFTHKLLISDEILTEE